LGLKKPEGTDIVDIADLNGNMDILDNAVNGKVDKVTGKQLSTNDYTAVEKTKLAGIATGANNYSHPNHTGDVTSNGDGVTAIAPGVIVDADVNVSAGIAWSKVSKTGASLADLPTRSAGDLSSGTLPAARLPAATGDVTSSAGSNVFTLSAGIQGQINSKAPLATTPQQTTADITYYVRTDGNDNNTGLANTAAGAFKTINKAISLLPQLCNHQITINVAAGTYAENVAMNDFEGRVTLQAGNTAVGQTNVQSITFTRCSGRFEANGFTGTSNTVTAFAALYCQQVILTSCWTTAGGAQNAVEFTFSSGRVQGGSYSNRSNGIVSVWCSNIYVNEVGGTGNAGYGLLAIRSSFIGAETAMHPTGVVDQYASSGSTIVTNGGGVVNPWGDNTKAARSAVGAHGGGGATQSVPTGVMTKVNFPTEYYDQLGEFTASTFTAQQAGMYAVSAVVSFLNVNDGLDAELHLFKSGIPDQCLARESMGKAGDCTLSGSTFTDLTAGQTITIYVLHTQGSNLSISGDGRFTQLRMVRVA
jgi:hypothetical protein